MLPKLKLKKSRQTRRAPEGAVRTRDRNSRAPSCEAPAPPKQPVPSVKVNGVWLVALCLTLSSFREQPFALEIPVLEQEKAEPPLWRGALNSPVKGRVATPGL